jgi:hypothetical protein
MSNTTSYWPRLTLLSLTGIYAISLAWSLSPFVKRCLYPSVCSSTGTNLDAKAAGGGQDPVCDPDTAAQVEANEPQGHDEHRPSIHHAKMRPEVRESCIEPTAMSYSRFDVQNGVDEKEVEHQSIQSIVTGAGGT